MRPTWHEYFIMIAYTFATRATCDRKHVGAVIVDDRHRIVSGGYNGSPAGLPHCDDVGHELKEINGRKSCVRTLHAESNALDRAGDRARGCTLYVTVTPCYECAKRIVNSGITGVVFHEFYASQNTELVMDLFRQSGIHCTQLNGKIVIPEFKSDGVIRRGDTRDCWGCGAKPEDHPNATGCQAWHGGRS